MRAAGVSVALAAATLTTTSVAAGAGAGTGAGAGAIATLKAFGVAKLVLLAVISAGAVTAAVVVSAPPRVPPAASSVAAPVAVSPVATVATATVVARPAAPAFVEPPPAGTTTTTPTPIPTPIKTADPVAVEARLLEAARTCLAAGDRTCAHAKLAEHAKGFAHGALADEASILAIDVALADGDRTEARRIARSLLARRPSGGWSSRVKKLADEAPAAHEENP